MGYVSVDIDMGDIGIDDLCDELITRISRKRIKDTQRKDLQEAVSDLYMELVGGNDVIPNKTLEDKLKIEFLSRNWDTFTSWDLEKKLL